MAEYRGALQFIEAGLHEAEHEGPLGRLCVPVLSKAIFPLSAHLLGQDAGIVHGLLVDLGD